MYLTRAFLNPDSRAVRADLRSPESLHKTVMGAFPDHEGPSPRDAHAVLHRLDEERDRLVLLVQSRTKPSVDRWPAGYVLAVEQDVDFGAGTVRENPAIRDVSQERASIRAGDRFAFRLCANTTKKIDTKSAPDGQRRHGRRVPVRGDEERLRWLTRHAEKAGFAFDVTQVKITEVAAKSGRSANAVTVAGARFDGVLVVRDSSAFLVALEKGIGPAKAYGFGLLSVARAR